MHPLAPPPESPMPRIHAAVDSRGRTTARPPPVRSPPFLHRAIFGNGGFEKPINKPTCSPPKIKFQKRKKKETTKISATFSLLNAKIIPYCINCGKIFSTISC